MMAQYFTHNGNHYDKCPENFVNSVINEEQKVLWKDGHHK